MVFVAADPPTRESSSSMRSKNLTANSPDGVAEIHVYGVTFACAVMAFCLSRWMGPSLGLASDLVAIAGDATCGWSWLLVRALFQPPTARRPPWPLALVLALVGVGAFLRLSDPPPGDLPRMVENLEGLVSAALLLLAALEPLTGLRADTRPSERRFRIAFSAGYATILAVAVLWVDGAPPGSFAAEWRTAIKAGCAVLALLGMTAAIWRRSRHPLHVGGGVRPRARTAEAATLGERVVRLIRDEGAFARQNLKVSDVARRLGEPEYKITQSITVALGFRNFNHLANQVRIEEAKRRLADPAFDRLPILTIAYDCGFGSVGPFNRAFKAEVGMTPKRFRQEARQSTEAPRRSDGPASRGAPDFRVGA